MHNKNFIKSLPKKRSAVGILIFNFRNELLVLKLGYSKYWNIPGGCVDRGEHLHEALKREMREEIGVEVGIKNCLVVDSKISMIDDYLDESLQFVFLGEEISDEEIEKIKIDGEEIIDYKFMSLEEAYKVLNPKMLKRIKALDGNYDDCLIMENGEII